MARYRITNSTGRIKHRGMLFVLNLTNTSVLKKMLAWRKAYRQINRLDTKVYLLLKSASPCIIVQFK